jgi:hypothetical protein
VEAGYDLVADRYAALEAEGNEWPRSRPSTCWTTSRVKQHAAIFERFLRWLEPEWLGQPMFFSQHDAKRTLELVREAGFEVLETDLE